ncbi:hypothetical protein P0E63_13725, partial [Enterococcus faecalis]|uniref:hypothetical protein n=1 Tax=Enterococcus faecalis TaxID=1351 RepID=UPI0025B243A7
SPETVPYVVANNRREFRSGSYTPFIWRWPPVGSVQWSGLLPCPRARARPTRPQPNPRAVPHVRPCPACF